MEDRCSLFAEGLSWEDISQQPLIIAKTKAKCKAKMSGQERRLMTLGEHLDQAIPEAYNFDAQAGLRCVLTVTYNGTCYD